MRIQESNPIGNVQNIPEFEEKVDNLISQWDDKLKNTVSGWLSKIGLAGKVGVSLATNFILMALDELIVTIDNLTTNGPDKKATVLGGIDRLYNHVVKEALPIWLKPFAYTIKDYIVYTLVSNFIDYIVEKYKNGSWKNKEVVNG